MNCEKTREIILTDYIDGCLSGRLKTAFESHLKQCSECRELAQTSLQILSEPFDKISGEKMPESLVQSIIERVREEQIEQEKTWHINFIESFKRFLSPSLPSMRFAMAFILAFMFVGIGTGVHRTMLAKEKEETGFLIEDMADLSLAKGKTSKSYGTFLETYFLNDKEES